MPGGIKITKLKDKILIKELGIDDLKTTKKKVIDAVTELVNSYETLWDLLRGCIRTPECSMNHELEIGDIVEEAIGTDSDTVYSLGEEVQEEELGYEEEEEEKEEEEEEEEEKKEEKEEAYDAEEDEEHDEE
ncbi:MAG: hypothetical protein WED07_12930 [Candidatus Freyarchaeum deiterrae]